MSSAREILDQAMTEAELQNWIVELAQRTGWKVAHFRPAQDRKGNWKTALQGDPGFPDLVMVHEEREILVFAELKSAKKSARTTPDQDAWIEALWAVAERVNRDQYHYPCVMVEVWMPWDRDFIEQLLVGELA